MTLSSKRNEGSDVAMTFLMLILQGGIIFSRIAWNSDDILFRLEAHKPFQHSLFTDFSKTRPTIPIPTRNYPASIHKPVSVLSLF